MRCASCACGVTPACRAPSLPRSGVAPARLFGARCTESVRARRRRAILPGRAVCDAGAVTCAAGLSSADKPCCAVSFVKATPPGDERQRDVCTTCGFVDYKNPKVVVATVVVRGRSVLLCKRAIEPSAGKWGFPQGAAAASYVQLAPLRAHVVRFHAQASWSLERAHAQALPARRWKRRAPSLCPARCWRCTTCPAACSWCTWHACGRRQTSGRDTSRRTRASSTGTETPSTAALRSLT